MSTSTSAGDPRLADLMAFARQAVPYWKTLGIELCALEAGKSRFEVTFSPALGQGEVMHGGVVASLVDSACALAALSRVWPGDWVTSITMNVSYLKPVSGGRIAAEGACLRVGRNLVFCEAKVWAAGGELVGRGSSELMRVPLPRRG